MNNKITAMLFVVFIILITIYASAGTEKRPIIGKNKRNIFKPYTSIIMTGLMTVSLSIPFENIKALIIFGAFIEVVTVLPITCKILKKGGIIMNIINK